MEINRKELRQTGRKQLKGNWLWVIGLLIIPGIINLFLEYITNYVWTVVLILIIFLLFHGGKA